MFALHFTRLIAAPHRVPAQGWDAGGGVCVSACGCQYWAFPCTYQAHCEHLRYSPHFVCVWMSFAGHLCVFTLLWANFIEFTQTHTGTQQGFSLACWHSSSLASLSAPNSPHSKQTSALSFLSLTHLLSLAHLHTQTPTHFQPLFHLEPYEGKQTDPSSNHNWIPF